MKNKYQLVSMCLLFFAILFTVTSCNQDESLLDLENEELTAEVITNEVLTTEAPTTEVNGRAIGGGGDGPDGPGVGYDSWYSLIRCEPNSGNVAEYSVYHKTLAICNCYTAAWEAANCAPGGTGNIVYCQKRTSPNTPFGALCPN